MKKIYRRVAMMLAGLYLMLGIVGPLVHGLESHEKGCESSRCHHGEGLVWEGGCEGPCSNTQHHHHSKSHDPHVCPTCQTLSQPALIGTVDLGSTVPVLSATALIEPKVIRSVQRVVTPPLRAPPPILL